MRKSACAAGLFSMIALALLVPPAPAAEAQLPVGEAKGVRVVREQGALVVVFTSRAARLYRRIAGKRVSVDCTELPEEKSLGLVTVNSGGVTLRAPKRRRPLRTGDLTRGLDYCRVWLEPRTVRRNGERHRLSRRVIVSVPLTQLGAIYLDELEKATSLFGLLLVIGVKADERHSKTWPTAPDVLEGPIGRRLGPRLVALSSPSDTPSAGAIGYYSDGQQHVAVVIVSASGRRLFIEFAADDALHTNVARYLGGGFD
jgi:hypothetical protein